MEVQARCECVEDTTEEVYTARHESREEGQGSSAKLAVPDNDIVSGVESTPPH